MKYDFKGAFNGVKLTEKRQQEIQTVVSSRLQEKQKENLQMQQKNYFTKKPRVFIIAIIAVLALSMVGFTYGNEIIRLLGGGNITQGKNETGDDFVSMDMGFEIDPVRIEKDQIYFILDGLNLNITKECSETNYFQYETITQTGARHVVVIGGTVDNVGMAEFVWDKNGIFKGSNASYNTPHEPQWLQLATQQLQTE